MLKILYDGWELTCRPNSPAALHLWTLLSVLPEEIEAVLVLPEVPPTWLPDEIAIHVHPAPDTALGRLRWEQRSLSVLAQQLGADLLHLTTATPPVFSSVPVVVSPAGRGSGAGIGFPTRVRAALAAGGMVRVSGLLWPDDLPQAPDDVPVMLLPPLVHTDFTAGSGKASRIVDEIDIPETYVLYHGPQDIVSLQQVLEMWIWAAYAVGEWFPLVLLGLDLQASTYVRDLVREGELGETLRILPPLPPGDAAALYRGCTALLHPIPATAWGGALRQALACDRPVVAVHEPLTEAIVREAAYLLPEHDRRGMGAALITVLGEESVAEPLRAAARKRAAAWQGNEFTERLLAAYKQVLG